ncbi:50S ribosomal protein L7 [Spiroplasma endosymbiont of Othius punctulatus]|uniref:L7Ae/L30e/S12e/Gadd45 family ribosomal protein n=1 Tax=Spiroplasma endosymbiont of Othius punctulatus TaxID=3066289 RepID=UPI0030D620FB
MDRLLNAFGMAYASGKVAIGEKLLDQIKNKKVLLVVIFADIGPSTLKKLEDKCKFYDVKVVKSDFTIDEVKSQFASKKVAAIGFNDVNITKLIEKNMNPN